MSSNFDRIPAELKALKQWLVWKLEYPHGMQEKPTKVPYAPHLNQHASVTSPHTWMSFEEACMWFDRGEFNGIGFVLTKHDPYGFIDLDDPKTNKEIFERQQIIYGMFDSYSERSPSGTGLHIIVKGNVERGRKRSQIEVYSSERYMTMTGDVYGDKPITDCQEALSMLWHQMGGPATNYAYGQDADEKEDDATILSRMFEAENGDKALDLYNGDWEKYPEYENERQSGADQALINIIAYYTQNRFQIVRIFRKSKLGQRPKALRDEYMTWTINKAFDRQLPPIDTEGLALQFEEMLAKSKEAASTHGADAASSVTTDQTGRKAPLNADAEPSAFDPTSPLMLNARSSVNIPKGLVGEIAEFVFSASPRPVAEISLVAALGLVAGITGRAYNISGAGLNQYLMIVAPTGTGKESINNGISKLLNAARAGAPSAMDFFGPGEIRSDAALYRAMQKHPVFVSVAGEFGIRMQRMCHERASPHELGLRGMLLDLYGKSGAGNTLQPMVYSDSQKNTAPIHSPAFTMIGESTQQRFFEALDESMVYEGLLPRFTLFEYKGGRPELNQKAFSTLPTFDLVSRLQSLIGFVQATSSTNSVINIDGDDEAREVFIKFNRYCDDIMRQAGQNELVLGFWSRAWLKAMKLAGTVAVGMDFETPVVDGETARWACDIVNNEITAMLGRFSKGEVGQDASRSESKQFDLVRKFIYDAMVSPNNELGQKYGLKAVMQMMKVFPVSMIDRRFAANAAFTKQVKRPSQLVEDVIRRMVKAGLIQRLPPNQCREQFKSSAEAYSILEPEIFSAESL